MTPRRGLHSYKIVDPGGFASHNAAKKAYWRYINEYKPPHGFSEAYVYIWTDGQSFDFSMTELECQDFYDKKWQPVGKLNSQFRFVTL